MTRPPPNPTPPAWDDRLLQSPHTVADKRRRVQQMFAAIAPKYDLNNRLHSFGRDQAWRKRAVKLSKVQWTERVVDVACGTGDLTIAFLNEMRRQRTDFTPFPGELNDQVIGIDFTYGMLPIAVAKQGHEPFEKPYYINGDAQALPLPDASADVVSIAFGIRNVQEPLQALREFRRILRPGGRLIILEFSQPTNPVLRWLNNLYCGRIMPVTATLISGDRSGAYKYLPKSVSSFMSRKQVQELMSEAGFEHVQQFPLTFGVCVCYRGVIDR